MMNDELPDAGSLFITHRSSFIIFLGAVMDSQIILQSGMPVPIKHWAFTVDDYMRMLEAGILTEDDRVELIDGEIIEMSPIGDAHTGCVIRLTMLFARLVGLAAFV